MQRNTFVRREAVNKEQAIARADLLHEPLHVAGVARQQAAAVAVDADRMRHGLQCAFKCRADLGAIHVQPDADRVVHRIGIVRLRLRLQRQVQQDLLAVFVSGTRQFFRLWRAGQERVGNVSGQRERALPGPELIAEVVDDDGDPGRGKAGVHRGRGAQQKRRQAGPRRGHWTRLCITGRVSRCSIACASCASAWRSMPPVRFRSG